jgi:hypothetical protein
MKQIYKIVCLILSLNLFAGNDNIPIGARSAGLGHASVSLSDVWSAQHNQAGLGFLKRPEAGVYYESRFLMPELGLSGAVVALPTSKGTFGLNVRTFGYELYSESKIGFSYARAFSEQLSIGMQLNYNNIRFAEFYGVRNTFTAEVGVQYKVTPQFTVAAHVYNPNRVKLADFNNERLPSIIRFGIGYNVSKKVLVLAEAEKDSYNKPMIKAGIEYLVTDNFYVRTGIASNPYLNSFGFGLIMKDLRIDFAGTFHRFLGFTPQLSLNYRFGQAR